MLADEKIDQLNRAFKRIFAYPIVRSTFKDIQREIFAVVDQQPQQANALLEFFLTGKLQAQKESPKLKQLLEDYGLLVRLSKDVFERGKYINFLSSDIISQDNQMAVSHLVRRIDGKEFNFLTEPEGVLQLIKHFLGRLEELGRLDKDHTLIKSKGQIIQEIKERLEKLLS